MIKNPYLQGNYAPLTEEFTAEKLRVRGEIPQELNGRFLRIGPNPLAPDPSTHHWFLGNGMVHGLRLTEGYALWFKSRFIRDDEITKLKGWQPVEGPVGKFQLSGGVANTNVIGHAGKIFALVEAGNLPVEINKDLETLGRTNFNETLTGGLSAHPHVDPGTGELHSICYSPLMDDLQYVVVSSNGQVRKTVDIPVPGQPMVHDCMITKNYVIVMDLPVIFDATVAAAGFKLPYKWHPEYGARIGLLPREGSSSQISWHEVEPCYVFHPMNSFEDKFGHVVLDVIRHDKMFSTDMLGPSDGHTTLDRWIIDPKKTQIIEKRLDDRQQEFPRIDDRRVGQPYRYGYTVDLPEFEEIAGLRQYDLKKGSIETHLQAGYRVFMEPVFVPRSKDADENEGWVLAYVYDRRENLSDVVIIDASNISAAPVATIKLPQRVPYGFHANWIPES